MIDPAALVASSPLGARMTVRRRVDGGFADALGYLRDLSDTGCVVETRRGLVAIPFAEITAARLVPPPPPPRAPRRPLT